MPAPARTKSHSSSSQCSNPRAGRALGRSRGNQSARRPIASQRRLRSNGPKNGHGRSLPRPWRAPSGGMHEAIAPGARARSMPPGTCTICNERLARRLRKSQLIADKISGKRRSAKPFASSIHCKISGKILDKILVSCGGRCCAGRKSIERREICVRKIAHRPWLQYGSRLRANFSNYSHRVAISCA